MLIWYSRRTNELYIRLKKEKTGEPLTGDVSVQVQLYLNGAVVGGTNATLDPTATAGEYYTKYPILDTVVKNKQYKLHLTVIVDGNEVIDEDIETPIKAI